MWNEIWTELSRHGDFAFIVRPADAPSWFNPVVMVHVPTGVGVASIPSPVYNNDVAVRMADHYQDIVFFGAVYVHDGRAYHIVDTFRYRG